MAGRGWARQGSARRGEVCECRGKGNLPGAFALKRGLARRGWARLGEVGQGKARKQQVSDQFINQESEMNAKTNSKMFFGGIPTRPDVQAIMDKIVLEAGQTVSKSEISQIIQQPEDSSRFYTVTTAWRKRMFSELNLEIIVDGDNYRALLPHERLSHNVGKFTRSGRMIARTMRSAATIKASDLSQDEQVRLSHFQRSTAAILGQMSEARKQIEPPKAAQSNHFNRAA